MKIEEGKYRALRSFYQKKFQLSKTKGDASTACLHPWKLRSRMNASKSIHPITKTNAFVALIAATLLALSLFVIFAWHHLNSPSTATITQMAYNTAICIALISLALFSLLLKRGLLLKLCALSMGIISSAKLFELFTGIMLRVDYWFVDESKVDALQGQTMAPATAVCIALVAASLLLFNKDKKRIISIVFLNLIVLVIAFIAILGNGIGIIPAFVWLGIRMAPHTAVGLSLFSIALIVYVHRSAADEFNQLNFFKRIVAGFSFMAVLVAALGSIAAMQIHTVSELAHDIYEKPLQISKHVDHIQNHIHIINQQLKSIADKKAVSEFQNITQTIKINEKDILESINAIRNSDPTLDALADKLEADIQSWSAFSRESWTLIEQGDFDLYSSRTLYQGQERIEKIEADLKAISALAQKNILNINSSVASLENEAIKLVLVFVAIFLAAGLIVSAAITRSITSQLQKIREIMSTIAEGNNVQTIPFLKNQEEIGEMARTLNVFQENLAARKDLETRLLQVIEAMPNGIVMINAEGTIEIINTQAENIFGYDRSELLGQPVEKLIPAKAAKTHTHNRNSFFADPSPRQMGVGRELFGLRRDGSEFPLEIGLAPVKTTAGLKVLASIVDITERRNANIALNESREKLELTTRINQIGIWEYIVEEGKLVWNDAMFEIYGRSKHYFTSDLQAWKQNIHPSDIESTENQLQDAIRNHTPFDCKYRIIQPDGTIKYLHAKAKVEYGSTIRILGTCTDITREELALAKIHNLEVLRSAIVEFSEDAIISKTPTGVITSWNQGAHNMFGYSAEEAIGRYIKDLVFPPELLHEEEMLLAQVRSGIVVKHFETRRRCKDGRTINVSITLSPIKDASGNIVGISAIKRDITDSITIAQTLSARTQELEQSNYELERSNKELETFAYVASHDLKSPLRGIAQLSTWIEEDLESNELTSVTQHTNLLRNRIQRMEKLLDDLLIFYRAGKADGQLIDLDMNQMVSDIFEIQNNKPGLVLEISNPLPKFTTLATPLELIIRNLLSNAIKHHDKDQGVIKISSSVINQSYFEFSVCDDGPGIPEKFHERVFGMFQTLKPRDELEGSGMGLALIKKLVENYGGQITLRSRGRGACFIFTWPQKIYRRTEND